LGGIVFGGPGTESLEIASRRPSCWESCV
jgi:hypothetical protein